MKTFYIETDQLTQFVRNLRFVYSENDIGEILLLKIIDPSNMDEVTFQSMIGKSDPNFLMNIQTAYMANYKRVYYTPDNKKND